MKRTHRVSGSLHPTDLHKELPLHVAIKKCTFANRETARVVTSRRSVSLYAQCDSTE